MKAKAERKTKMLYSTRRTSMTKEELQEHYNNVVGSGRVHKDRSKFDKKKSRRHNKVRDW